jgi:large subunit ribosomal protein L29
MKSSEIRELSISEINERMSAEQEKYSRMKLGHAISPLDNPMLLVEARKNIARLKTELRKRQLSENK